MEKGLNFFSPRPPGRGWYTTLVLPRGGQNHSSYRPDSLLSDCVRFEAIQVIEGLDSFNSYTVIFFYVEKGG